MNDVPTYEDVPVFGTSADISKPEPTTYDDGYTGGEVFPAEEENWFMNKLTTNGLLEQDNLNATMEEIISVLTEQGIAPDDGLHDQLLQAIIGIANDRFIAGITTFVANPVSFDDDVDIGGALQLAGDLLINGSSFTVNHTTGAVSFIGDLSINTNKFTVLAASGNVGIAGVLSLGKTLLINQTQNYNWGASTTQGTVFTALNAIFGSSFPNFYAIRGVIDPGIGYGPAVTIERVDANTFTIVYVDVQSAAQHSLNVVSGSGTQMASNGAIYAW
jgi:hypothetical protein